jgi:hypothetical protein
MPVALIPSSVFVGLGDARLMVCDQKTPVPKGGLEWPLGLRSGLRADRTRHDIPPNVLFRKISNPQKS